MPLSPFFPFPSLLFSEGKRWFPLPSPGVVRGSTGGGSCGAWSGIVERGGGSRVRVATSEEASPRSDATLSRHS
ncbi:hypothetical protein Taro_004673 [Colocasia esculenta]|uniref:Uncharacterized protein n=1 Tax=Colocasia esculenta TaxID=4460 RepID=A0A843TSB2_COLES|nr:hypothetical protein [Colocasia esculenta]